jgi:hypothetical protein
LRFYCRCARRDLGVDNSSGYVEMSDDRFEYVFVVAFAFGIVTVFICMFIWC